MTVKKCYNGNYNEAGWGNDWPNEILTWRNNEPIWSSSESFGKDKQLCTDTMQICLCVDKINIKNLH